MSNVLSFTPRLPTTPDRPIVDTVTVILNLDKDDELVSVQCTGQESATFPGWLADILMKAAWWHAAEFARVCPDHDGRQILMASIEEGSRVRVFSFCGNHPDAFNGEDRQAWLKRRMDDIYELALPSWSAEQPASGMTSPSHSANIDQLSFSW